MNRSAWRNKPWSYRLIKEPDQSIVEHGPTAALQSLPTVMVHQQLLSQFLTFRSYTDTLSVCWFISQLPCLINSCSSSLRLKLTPQAVAHGRIISSDRQQVALRLEKRYSQRDPPSGLRLCKRFGWPQGEPDPEIDQWAGTTMVAASKQWYIVHYGSLWLNMELNNQQWR